MMLRKFHRYQALGLFFFGAVFVGWSGCGSDPAEPEDTEPTVVVPTMIGTLSRINGEQNGAGFRDEFSFWVSDARMDSTDRLRFGGMIDESAEAGDPDGFVFQLAPAAGTSLFALGQNLSIELLAAGGGVVATAFCEGPAADLVVLFPVAQGQASVSGIDVRWRSDGEGAATIRLLSQVDGTSWETVTSDFGEYEISAAKLADFPKGPCRLEIIAESSTSLAGVELGNGTISYSMSGIVVFSLEN